MRLSVALCTLDGERYLPELLRSIAAQQRLPDEMVVGDDGSTDATIAVLEKFAVSAPFPVRIHRSPVRRGVTGNFSDAMSRCGGDILVLGDQDDVWAPNKLAELESAFTPSGVAAAFSDAVLVGADGEPLGRTLWAELHLDEQAQAQIRAGRGLPVLLRRNVITGATLAVSADIASVALPFPPDGLHDVWLGWVAACLGPVVPVPLPLISYRQHDANVVGAPRRRLHERLSHRLALGDVSAGEAAHLGMLVERLRNSAPPVDESSLALIEDKIAHLRVRSALSGGRVSRLRPAVREIRRGRYASYGRRWESVAFDLLFRPTTRRRGPGGVAERR